MSEIKTLLNGIREWVHSAIKKEAPQADWNVNDPSDPAYVKGRTHWDHSIRNPIRGLTYSCDISFNRWQDHSIWNGHVIQLPFDGFTLPLEMGQTWHVFHDEGMLIIDDDYEVQTDENGEFILLIRSKSGYELLAIYSNRTESRDGEFYDAFDPGVITITGVSGIITVSKNLKTIDEKYLPSFVRSVNGEDGDVKLTAESIGAMAAENPVASGAFSMGRKAGTTVGSNSHAEGEDVTASGNYSHAEGHYTKASGLRSHAEGWSSEARADSSHAEGFHTSASGDCSHAEGSSSTASGESSHAEGVGTEAIGNYSHAEGYVTGAYCRSQHVEGEYNVKDKYNKSERGQYVHIVGNGTYTTRSNAHTLDWDGNAWFAGNVYVGSTSGTNRDDGSKKLATEDSIPTALPNPNKLTITGAVEAEYDGSEAVSVEIPAGDTSLGVTGASVGQTVKITAVDDAGKLTAWEAVDMGGGKSWRKIADITLEEDATEILVDTDEDGNALSLQAMTVRCLLVQREGSPQQGDCWAYIGGAAAIYRSIFAVVGLSQFDRSVTGLAYFFPDSVWGLWGTIPLAANNDFANFGYGTLFKLVSKTDGFVFPAGSRLVIYGIDA